MDRHDVQQVDREVVMCLSVHAAADELMDIFAGDPDDHLYERYARIREPHPIVPVGDQLFALSFEAAADVVRRPIWVKDSELRARSRAPELARHRSLQIVDRSVLQTRGTSHRRMRRAFGTSMSPQAVEAMRRRIDQAVDSLIDAALQSRTRGVVDIVKDVAEPLPLRVVGDLMGIPHRDRPRLYDYMKSFSRAMEPAVDHDLLAEADHVGELLDRFFRDLADVRRSKPADDLITEALLRFEEFDDVAYEDLIASYIIVFGAGLLTTTHMIGNGMQALLDRPAQLHHLNQDPQLAATAVEEFLRYDPPVQLVSRQPVEDTTLCGRPVAAGTVVVAVLGAANRDPEQFDRPDHMDIRRDAAEHLSFGGGSRRCLGAALARLEGESLFSSLARDFDAASAGDPTRTAGFVFRGYSSVHVDLERR